MNEEKRETRDEREARLMAEKLERLNSLRQLDPQDIKGYVYRETYGGTPTALPPIEMVLDDHEFGQLYGPGKYRVTFVYIDDDGKRIYKQERYNIGVEYARIHREYCQANGIPCYMDSAAVIPGLPRPGLQMGDILKDDNLKSILTILAFVKQAFGSSGGKDDLLKYVLDQQKLLIQTRPQIGDGVLQTALQQLGTNKQNPAKELREQLSLFSEMKNLFGETPAGMAQQSEQMEPPQMSPVERVISQVIDYLPELMKNFGGNVDAAAKAQRSNPLVKLYLQDREAQKAFFKSCAAKYGIGQARQWAAGLGLNPEILESAINVAAEVVGDAIRL